LATKRDSSWLLRAYTLRNREESLLAVESIHFQRPHRIPPGHWGISGANSHPPWGFWESLDDFPLRFTSLPEFNLHPPRSWFLA
jgi:hypothetical protein